MSFKICAMQHRLVQWLHLTCSTLDSESLKKAFSCALSCFSFHFSLLFIYFIFFNYLFFWFFFFINICVCMYVYVYVERQQERVS